MITRIQVEVPPFANYENGVERIYLGCGADGVACVEFGHEPNDEYPTEVQTQHPESLLACQFAEFHFLGGRPS